MSIRKTLAVLLTAGTVVAFGLSAKPAHADLVPILTGAPTAITSGTYAGDYLFTYSVSLSASSYVGGGTNAFVTLYDVEGLPSTSLTSIDLGVGSNPTGLTVTPSIQNVGITPVGTLPADDPTIPNLSFTLTKGTQVVGPVNPILVFSFADTLPSFSDFDSYGGFTTNSNNNTSQSNIGSVQLPSGTRITATPEPASYAAFVLGGLGLLGLSLKARRRQTVA